MKVLFIVESWFECILWYCFFTNTKYSVLHGLHCWYENEQKLFIRKQQFRWWEHIDCVGFDKDDIDDYLCCYCQGDNKGI